MFGTTISFKQFFVLCIILYCLFGDPVNTIWKYRRRRRDRYRAKGYLPKFEQHPIIGKIEKFEKTFRLDVQTVSMVSENLKTYMVRTLTRNYINEYNQHNRILTYYNKVFNKAHGFYTDYLTVVSNFKKQEAAYLQKYHLYNSLHHKLWTSAYEQTRYLRQFSLILSKYLDIVFFQMEELLAIQLKIYSILIQMNLYQLEFRRQQIEFRIEKEKFLRQLEEYKQYFESKFASQSETKQDNK